MKKLLAALMFGAAIAAGSVAVAQEVGVPLNLQAGQSYTIRMDIRETIITGDEEVSVTMGAVYALDILSHTPTDRRWLYTPVSIDYSDIASLVPEAAGLGIDWALASEGISALGRVFADIGFECRVDAYGRCEEWSNWSMWSARAENTVLAVDAFARMAEAIGAPTEETKASTTSSAAADPEGGMSEAPPVSWATMREPVLLAISALLDGVDSRSAASMVSSFHPLAAVQGRTMTRGETQPFAEAWPMPFGAPPINVTGTLTLDRVDRRAGTATFVRHATVDAPSVTASLEGMSEYMITRVIAPAAPYFGDSADSVPDADAMRGLVQMFLPMFNFSMEETTTGIVDLNTGMARQSTTDLTFTMNGPPDMPEASTTVRLNYVLTVEPGAPSLPRLPRAAAN